MNPLSKKYIAVVDYGLGNLRSVAKALESVGAEVVVTSNPKEILDASGIVLPGVGAARVKVVGRQRESGQVHRVSLDGQDTGCIPHNDGGESALCPAL